jgi:hypothetical protein
LRLAKALTALGRAVKTAFVLRYISGEARPHLAKHLRDGTPERSPPLHVCVQRAYFGSLATLQSVVTSNRRYFE